MKMRAKAVIWPAMLVGFAAEVLVGGVAYVVLLALGVELATFGFWLHELARLRNCLRREFLARRKQP